MIFDYRYLFCIFIDISFSYEKRQKERKEEDKEFNNYVLLLVLSLAVPQE